MMRSDTRQGTPYTPLRDGPSDHKLQEEGKKWSILWRIICCVMVVFFLLGAYVQINDPDPFIWIPAYLVPALLSLGIVVNPNVTSNIVWKTVCVVHIALCAAGILYLLIVVVELLTHRITNPLEHEEGRELGGTTIILVWLCFCRFTTLGSTDPAKGSANALLLVTLVLGTLPLAFWGLCFIEGLDKKLGHCKDMFAS